MYEALKGCRDFGLRDQMTRAAVSIVSNIAEGAERDSVAEYIRFLHIAKGSAAELRPQLIIAARIGVIPEETKQSLSAELIMISKQLHGLITYLKTKIKPES